MKIVRLLLLLVKLFIGSWGIILATAGGLIFRWRPRQIIWTPIPTIHNKYWSLALKRIAIDSITLMNTCYSINNREDFDLYFEDLVPLPSWKIFNLPRRLVAPYFAFFYIVRKAKAVCIPFSGGPLGFTPFWWSEGRIFKILGIRTVIAPYGTDILAYSLLSDPSWKHGLMLSYPLKANDDEKTIHRIRYWSQLGDVIIASFFLEGLSNWDIVTPNYSCIDTDEWPPKSEYSTSNGIDGPVRILHAPNHRGPKGTEFIIHAVTELKKEGLNLELVLLEGVPNRQIRDLMREVDILADQCICAGHGIFAIEGMASGLPVMANLEDQAIMNFFRRYSFFDECPIVSSSPETLKDNLRILVRNPKLREVLGKAGRAYTEKYHSLEAGQYLFTSIFRRIFNQENVDLLNLYHPLKSEFNRRLPIVRHPLVQNRLPLETFRRLTQEGDSAAK